MDFLFVTGMSGAGKTVAVNELEDMGYFCVDNIPSGLIGAFARLCEQSPVGGRIALVTDFRSGEQFARFPEALDQLTAEGHTYRILMLEAEDSVILRRYKENRRRHPLLEEGSAGLEAAIRTERKLLEPLRLRADYRIDTSFITIAQLRERVEQLFGDDSGKMIVTCMSFGYKYGIPAETDLLFDVRCLPNPFYVPELREHTRPGTGSPEYVLAGETSQGLVQRLDSLLDYLLPLYLAEGKCSLVIGFGCTGGRHRSVTFAELFRERLARKGYRGLGEPPGREPQPLKGGELPMAFASEVRTEILENLTLRKKFRKGAGYGLLLCSKHFDAGEISMIHRAGRRSPSSTGLPSGIFSARAVRRSPSPAPAWEMPPGTMRWRCPIRLPARRYWSISGSRGIRSTRR